MATTVAGRGRRREHAAELAQMGFWRQNESPERPPMLKASVRAMAGADGAMPNRSLFPGSPRACLLPVNTTNQICFRGAPSPPPCSRCEVPFLGSQFQMVHTARHGLPFSDAPQTYPTSSGGDLSEGTEGARVCIDFRGWNTTGSLRRFAFGFGIARCLEQVCLCSI